MGSPLEDFLEKFGETELPALYSTVRGISKINEDSDVPVDALADLIRSDASMTSHILKHTQGAYRIPLRGKHNTINRAIVMLGFKEVRSLCLTVSILEGLSSENASEAFVGELARIFHGALQARSIALLRGERSCEEVFTTAILSRIGHLLFWASGDSRVDLLYSAYKKGTPDQFANIERAILGFTLSELSVQVMSSWGLQEFSRRSDLVTNKEEIRFDATDLGMELAENAALGWDSSTMNQVVNRVAAYLDLPQDIVKGTLRENTLIASQYAQQYQVEGLAEEIKSSLAIEGSKDDKILEEDTADGNCEATFDPAFQLKILNKIGTTLEEGIDINKIIGLALEGVYKGVGFDRVLFALLTPNRKQLRGKAGLGLSYKRALESFKIDIGSNDPSIFDICMNDGDSLWLKQGLVEEKNIPENFKAALLASECILVPLVVTNRSIGMFYADKVGNDREISVEDFSALKQFVFQVQLALEHIQGTSKKASKKGCFSSTDSGTSLKI